jgi:hypothetical protein
MEEKVKEEEKDGEANSRIIFMGTGTSEGIPLVSCLVKVFAIPPSASFLTYLLPGRW